MESFYEDNFESEILWESQKEKNEMVWNMEWNHDSDLLFLVVAKYTDPDVDISGNATNFNETARPYQIRLGTADLGNLFKPQAFSLMTKAPSMRRKSNL